MVPSLPNNSPLFGGDVHFAGERCIGMLSDPQTIRTNVLYFYYYSLTMVLLCSVPLGAQKTVQSNYLTLSFCSGKLREGNAKIVAEVVLT